MCGICGIVRPGRPVDERVLRGMQSLLHHRGPDDCGVWTEHDAGLAMARLSIIDCETGAQPIANEDRTLWIVFNGEIYNFPELREGLLERGHVFTTRSDTEVVLHLFEEKRERCLDDLHGMFAFAVYDRSRRELFLARDRFGEKPLFYAHRADGFAFASEIRSLLASGFVPRRLNDDVLCEYLVQGYVDPPATLFGDVRQLPAAHYLRFCNGTMNVARYWEYRVEPERMDLQEAAGEFRRRLEKAARRQMISDVPLGAFLSGGLDSSSVVAMMARAASGPVKTFTVRFPNARYDEGVVAQAVARHFDTEHHELFVRAMGFSEEALFRIVDHVGVPFPDSSAIPTFLLSSYAREHVKVCLSGDGGDEMLGGYDAYLWVRQLQKAGRIPAIVRSTAHAAALTASRLPFARRSSRLRQLHKGLRYSLLPAAAQLVAVTGQFTPDEVRSLWCRPTGEPRWAGSYFDAHPVDALPVFHAMQKHRAEVGLTEDMLVKVDRMSMAASLETRAPFLDWEVVDFARRLPDNLKIDGGTTKVVLREAMRDVLPREVFEHPKMGFSIPLHDWFNADFGRFATEHLSKDRVERYGLFRWNRVAEIVSNGVRRTRDYSDRSVYSATHQLWSLLVFQLWLERFDVQVGEAS